MSKKQKVVVSARHPVQLAKGTWIYADTKEDALRMIKSLDLCTVLWEITHRFLREKLKYGHEYKSADEALESVQQALFDAMIDNNINLDELYS